MQIHLSSIDHRALDHSVRMVCAAANTECVAVPMLVPTIKTYLPNGTLVSAISRRCINLDDCSDALFNKFAKMILPTGVDILINF